MKFNGRKMFLSVVLVVTLLFTATTLLYGAADKQNTDGGTKVSQGCPMKEGAGCCPAKDDKACPKTSCCEKCQKSCDKCKQDPKGCCDECKKACCAAKKEGQKGGCDSGCGSKK